MRVVLQDCQRRYEEIDLPESTTELEIPEGIMFSGFGVHPTHCHDLTRDNGHSYKTVAMFVARDRCHWCAQIEAR